MSYEWNGDTRVICVWSSSRVHSGTVPGRTDPLDYLRLVVAGWKNDV